MAIPRRLDAGGHATGQDEKRDRHRKEFKYLPRFARRMVQRCAGGWMLEGKKHARMKAGIGTERNLIS